MSQIKTKFIKDDAVTEAKIKLGNDGALRARNAADSADVDLMKLDGSDKLQLLVMPEVSSDAVSDNQLVRKSQLDTEIGNVSDDLGDLADRVLDIENDYGAANGLATLDANGKLSSGQIPALAISEIHVVADIAARDLLEVEEGDVAKVLDAGSGLPKTYIYDGASWIEIESGSDVDTVNGQTGAVVLDTDDISEGSSNLYFTATRAKTAAVADSITDGVTDVAPSQNAVFDALAAKQELIDALEAASVQHVQEKFTLSSGDISNGYVTLANLAIGASINAYVDRLAIHQTDDYTLSTVSGVTRMTFAGELVGVGKEKLTAGDVVHVKYAKLAIA